MSITDQNSDTWRHRRFRRHYLGTELRPAETEILTRYSSQFSGRVLEVGCGAGRATGHLAARAAHLDAIDIAEPMLAEARRRHLTTSFHALSMTDLSHFPASSFDAVIATCNVIDVLDDDARRGFLSMARVLLDAEGVLVFSSHNRAHIPLLKEPWQLPTHRPAAFANALARLPLRLRNRAQLRSLVVRETDYDILNDSAHDWRLLQYYIAPADQRVQLGESGFELRECVDLEGDAVADDEPSAEPTELYYVASPSGQGADPQNP